MAIRQGERYERPPDADDEWAVHAILDYFSRPYPDEGWGDARPETALYIETLDGYQVGGRLERPERAPSRLGRTGSWARRSPRMVLRQPPLNRGSDLFS
jgi:hypothetical protein